MADDGGVEPRSDHWLMHGTALAVLALGGAIGLPLWGKWGFLIAFDTIRAYCF
ncbi:MAG: hypothetical protein AAF637_24285 [Pseudomonadota bacterium]